MATATTEFATARYLDPAENLDFARHAVDPIGRFDIRPDAVLRDAAFSEPNAIDRERALWELADRGNGSASVTIQNFIRTESDRAARANALWLLARTSTNGTFRFLHSLFGDEDSEVADWARLLTEQFTNDPSGTVYKKANVREDRTFDQTLPLVIAGYVFVTVPQLGTVKAVLSPLWFESIMGRVMACTNAATVMRDLVVEKSLAGLHKDGSKHYEVFKFSGVSVQLAERVYQHHYQSLTARRFYHSGVVERGQSTSVPTTLDRVATTEFADASEYVIEGQGGDRLRRLKKESFVRSVYGRFSGWAAVHLDGYRTTGRISPGEVQLSSPTHPVAGPMTNARLFGTFRGKIADHDGDGQVDVNSIECHGTVNGEHDLRCDGSKADDPFAS